MSIIHELRNKTSRDNRELLDRAADEIERLLAENKSLIEGTAISVLANSGKLKAEIGGDPDYPEIFVYLEREDGVQIDLVAVGHPTPESKDMRAYLYGDTTRDDYTQSYTWHEEALKAEVK